LFYKLAELASVDVSMRWPTAGLRLVVSTTRRSRYGCRIRSSCNLSVAPKRRSRTH